MDIKKEINPADYEVGVIVARFQVHELHEAHRNLIDKVCSHHKKVIIFLGCPVIENTRNNPLDFATRKIMIQNDYPNVVILPQKDQRTDAKWSSNLDESIRIPFGDRTTLLYGGRDSFIPHYKGKHTVTELTTDVFFSGTEIRKEVSREILSSKDFRAGVIHANYAKMSVTYPTVDVVAENEKGQILLGKKLNENNYRFIGGFVDRTDECWEQAAKREFMEETGGCEIDDLKYVASSIIKDWRYAKEESGIMTTLYLGKFIFGRINPSDDIASLHWVYPTEIDIEKDLMPEHQDLFKKLLVFMVKQQIKTQVKQTEEAQN